MSCIPVITMITTASRHKSMQQIKVARAAIVNPHTKKTSTAYAKNAMYGVANARIKFYKFRGRRGGPTTGARDMAPEAQGSSRIQSTSDHVYPQNGQKR